MRTTRTWSGDEPEPGVTFLREPRDRGFRDLVHRSARVERPIRLECTPFVDAMTATLIFAAGMLAQYILGHVFGG